MIGGPARTSDVIKLMCFLADAAPLSLTHAQTKRYFGHSLHHLLPTLTRLFGFVKEDRDQLARWAPTPEARGARRALSNMYAQEAECARVLSIVSKLLARLMEVVRDAGGPESLPPVVGGRSSALTGMALTSLSSMPPVPRPLRQSPMAYN